MYSVIFFMRLHYQMAINKSILKGNLPFSKVRVTFVNDVGDKENEYTAGSFSTIKLAYIYTP